MYGLVSYISSAKLLQTVFLESELGPRTEGDVMAASKVVQEPARRRKRDAVQTRGEILEVATKEFADEGYTGARVDRIAANTRTTKRMIYYYFGGKEQLFVTVLERAYAAIRDAEQGIDVEHLDPIAAIRRLAQLTFDHHESNPDFIRLVSIENIHRAEHLVHSDGIGSLNTTAIDLIATILERGRASGLFTRDADAVDVHMMISSFCVFRVANRHTFGAIFDRDLTSPSLREHYRDMLADMVVAYLTG